MDALEHALKQSTTALTKKWSEFVELHLADLSGITNRVSELKELTTKSAPSTATSSTMAPPQQDIRQWPLRDPQGQVSSAILMQPDIDSRPQTNITAELDYTKMPMSELHLRQLAITK